MGRLQPLIDDPDIENIEVNGYDHVWIAYADGREVRGEPVAASDVELVELIQALATRTGQAERSFSTASPTLHLRLDDGSRLTAMAWVTPRPVVVIRRHRVRDVSLEQMVAWGSMSQAVAAFLGAAIRAGKNVIVTGAQNSSEAHNGGRSHSSTPSAAKISTSASSNVEISTSASGGSTSTARAAGSDRRRGKREATG